MLPCWLLSVCGDGWFNLCALMFNGMKTHSAPESNHSDSGKVRLINPAINYTHSTTLLSHRLLTLTQKVSS